MSMYAINDTVVQRVTSNPGASPPRPYLRLVPPPSPSPRRTSAAAFQRRRLVAMVVIIALVLATKAVITGATADSEAPRAGGAAAAPLAQGSSGEAYVVKRGDTLWAIARRLQPDGDVRPVVDRLAAQRGGAPLRVGERITVP